MRIAWLVLAVTGCVESESVDEAAVVVPLPVPSITTALASCGSPGSVPPLPAGTDLQRADLDLAVFPDAQCNDGTGAAFFFRPAATLAGQTRWVIELQGGGGCHSGDDCARRWCAVGTNFGMDQMSATLLPAVGTRAEGILYRGPAATNPLADANHVLLKYCTSDMYAGHSGPIVVNAAHPVTGAAVQFMLRFEGQAVLDATIATLRGAGAVPPSYTLGGGAVAMPDLDDATEVVLAGASAGGGGTINNVDRLGDLLRANNTTGALAYRAVIDSTFGPSNETLDWTTSAVCAAIGACTWQDVLAAASTLFVRHGDESCATWHGPATAWLCGDTDHVLRNHVTTPFMLRQGLRDQLLSTNAIASGASIPGVGAMTLPRFSQLVRDQMLALATLPATAEEAVATVPATYGPPCPFHDTLSNNLQTYNTLLAGPAYTMFDVYANWLAGAAPSRVVYGPGVPYLCP